MASSVAAATASPLSDNCGVVVFDKAAHFFDDDISHMFRVVTNLWRFLEHAVAFIETHGADTIAGFQPYHSLVD